MVNRFFEQDPTNQVSGNALLSRAGTTLVQTVGDGPIRALYSQSGAFDSGLFVVSKRTLFLIGVDGSELEIEGSLDGPANPWMTIATGPGYQHLFVSDGLNLYLYEGESFARNTLSGNGGTISAGDQVRIGDTYYEFTAGSVDAGSPDGSSSDPWLVALGLAKASARLVFLNDGRIDIAGYAVFIGDIPAGTPPGEGGDLRYVYTMSAPDELERNNPSGTGDNPWRLATREGITARSYLSLLKSAINATGSPGVDYSRELVQPHPLVKADEVAGTTSPANPRDNYLTVRALQGGADGNDIQVRNVLDRAPIFQWEDDAGNPVQSLTGGSDVSSDIESSLENLARAIDGTGIPGTDYSTALTAHPDVRVESQEGNDLILVARERGADANTIDTTTTSTGVAWEGSTMFGGGEHRLDEIETPDDFPAGPLNSLGGFVVVGVYEEDRFYWILPGARQIDPLNFATAESEPDRIVEILTLADQLVIFGGSTSEFWSATGNPELPFRPSRGQTLDIGALPNTPAKTPNGLIFVGSDGAVYTTNGGPVQRVSTHGIDERIRLQLGSLASDEGLGTFTFEQDGHQFFVLHLEPTPPAPLPPDPSKALVMAKLSAESGEDAAVVYDVLSIPFTPLPSLPGIVQNETCRDVTFSNSGRFLAIGLGGVNSATTVELWDYETGSPVRIAPIPDIPPDACPAISFSNDDRWLFAGAGGTGNGPQLWDMTTGVPVSVPDIDTFLDMSARDVGWSKDDDFFLWVGGGPPYMKLFSFTGPGATLLTRPATDDVNHTACHWHPTEQRVAIGRQFNAFDRLEVYSYDSLGNWSTLPITGSSVDGSVNGLRWRPQGDYLAVATSNTTPYLQLFRNTASGILEVPVAVPVLANEAFRCSWSSDGRYLAVGINDNAAPVAIFEFDAEAETLTQIADPDPLPSARIFTVAFSPGAFTP